VCRTSGTNTKLNIDLYKEVLRSQFSISNGDRGGWRYLLIFQNGTLNHPYQSPIPPIAPLQRKDTLARLHRLLRGKQKEI
jgi:hypothetical protein